MKKFISFLILFVVCLGGLLILLKNPLLQSMGHFLIYEDEYTSVPYAFVLSGNSYDRGNEAIQLWKEGKINYIVCTGENQPSSFKAIDLDMMESELTAQYIQQNGVSVNHIEILAHGTSTREESNSILQYCTQYDIDSIVVISSLFHTRRIHNVFSDVFKEEGIQVFIDGTPSSQYREAFWWHSEEGMIAVNNEYAKLIYYWLMY